MVFHLMLLPPRPRAAPAQRPRPTARTVVAHPPPRSEAAPLVVDVEVLFDTLGGAVWFATTVWLATGAVALFGDWGAAGSGAREGPSPLLPPPAGLGERSGEEDGAEGDVGPGPPGPEEDGDDPLLPLPLLPLPLLPLPLPPPSVPLLLPLLFEDDPDDAVGNDVRGKNTSVAFSHVAFLPRGKLVQSAENV